MEITLRLTRSTSTNWPQALALLQVEPTHRVGDGPATSQHTVTFAPTERERLQALLDVAGNWRGTEVMLDGSTVDRRDLDRLLDCYQASCGTGAGREHCCGCEVQPTSIGSARQLFPCRMIPISESNYLGWHNFGRMQGEVFRVDKERLRQRIDQHLTRSLAGHCPALDRAAIARTLADLPEMIDPRRDRQWIYRHGWVNGRYRVIGVEKQQVGVPAIAGRGTRAEDAPISDALASSASEVNGADAGHEASAGRDIPTVHYSDVGGVDAQLRRLREAVELPLRCPELYERLGITPHNGVLLYGPPGTGKTLLAKAVATEAKAHFILINGPEIISKFHGESERQLRELFAEAKQKAPAVILIDELDAIAPARSLVSHNFEAVLVSQLLTLMDGLVDRGQVAVIGTTNRPDGIDPALRRPGRLDLQLAILLPDEAGRLAILRIHTRRMPLAVDVSLPALAAATEGFSGAALAALCREAGLCCLREVIDVAALDQSLAIDDDELIVTPAHFTRALAGIHESGEAANALVRCSPENGNTNR